MPSARHRRDDDRPRRRSEDDHPRDRRPKRDDRPADKKGRQRRSPALIVGAAAGAFALLLAIGIVIYVVARDTGKPASTDLLSYAPADAVILSGYDIDELSRTE